MTTNPLTRSFLAVLAVVALAAAGCGSSSSSKPAPTSAAPATQPAQSTPAAAPTTTSASGGGGSAGSGGSGSASAVGKLCAAQANGSAKAMVVCLGTHGANFDHVAPCMSDSAASDADKIACMEENAK